MSGKLAICGSVLSIVILLAATPMFAAECQPLTEPVLALEMLNPAGSVYVNILNESDGPVLLPIESSYAEALQISTRIEETRILRVVIHSVVDDFTIEPLGKYDLALSRELDFSGKILSERLVASELWDVVELHELEALGLHGWSARLTILRPSLTKAEDKCGCCTCGSLYCCPHAGQCIGCGNCGDCCCAGPV